ncbi:MAG: hypothetical protein ACREQR_20475 [Candidatus Binataceae bacterium]
MRQIRAKKWISCFTPLITGGDEEAGFAALLSRQIAQRDRKVSFASAATLRYSIVFKPDQPQT